MSNPDPRAYILQMIEDGKITAAEGVRLLDALQGGAPEKAPEPVVAPAPAEAQPGPDAPAAPTAETPPAPETPTPPAAPPPDLAGWRNWWLIPLAVGIGITLAGGGLMYWALLASGSQLSGWFWLAACPFAGGVLVMALAAASRSAKWIHVRVKTGEAEWPRQIALSFPLPIRPAAWFVRTFGRQIPALDRTGLDELILALGESATPQTPLYVEVDEGGDGEKVQVYIG